MKHRKSKIIPDPVLTCTNWSKREIKQTAYTNLQNEFSIRTLQAVLPEWVKDSAAKERAEKQHEKSGHSKNQDIDESRKQEHEVVAGQINPEYQEYIQSVYDRWDSLRYLIADLSGLKTYDERARISDSNRELVEKTKAHRFKIIKQLHNEQLKETYNLSMTARYLIDDFLKDLDNEVDVRQQKVGIGEV